jgi:hypothetical protein
MTECHGKWGLMGNHRLTPLNRLDFLALLVALLRLTVLNSIRAKEETAMIVSI